HGFSSLIERDDKKYLFDTGPGMSLPLNLKALNKDLDRLEKVFMSHGHYDHTGGLKWVIQQVSKVEVVAHPDIFSRHMVLNPQDTGEPPRYIGCQFSQDELEQSGAAFTFIDHAKEVSPGLWFVTGINPDPEKLPNDARLLIPQGDEFVRDPLKDDASLLIETDSAPILVLGCAHAGVFNILDYIRENMGITKLRAILGGTHLMFFGPKDVRRAIDKFEEFSIDLIGVSHCTGFQAAVELSKHFGDRFRLASAGSVFSF
ncbi:MAG: MBL fold metallo-hydrolase, partial [Deltaproteobacteria bacterium]|nr:MBL fold metallo-hydrolase [Deltaproteobacteria bacterium]